MGIQHYYDGDTVFPKVFISRIKSESTEILLPNQSVKGQKDFFVRKAVEKCEFQRSTPSAPVILAKAVTPSLIL